MLTIDYTFVVFDSTKDGEVQYNENLTIIVLTFWSISLLQFSMVFTDDGEEKEHIEVDIYSLDRIGGGISSFVLGWCVLEGDRCQGSMSNSKMNHFKLWHSSSLR